MKQKILILSCVIGLSALLANGGRALALDRESIECLSCHDAALATDSTIHTICSEPGCDHPLGVNYVFLATRNFGLKSPAELDPAIQLAGADIGCGTCHVPYSSLNHSTLSAMRADYPASPDPMLSLDNRESGLCLGCHLK